MDIRSCTIAPRITSEKPGAPYNVIDYEVLQLRMRNGETAQYTSYHAELPDALEQIRRFMEGSFDPWEEETQQTLFDDGNNET